MISSSDEAYLRNAMQDAFLFGSEYLELQNFAKTEVFAGDTCLHYAALRGDVRSVQLLIELGADPNKPGDMGSTPLHNALQANFPEIAKLLLAAGADPRAVDEFGRIPGEP